MPKQRIFSGVQPTGQLHLGNYLGAIKNFVALQHDYDCIYCVVDLHALTVWQEPATLAPATRAVTATYLAAGIDPESCIIFNQSQVPAHAELAWIFNCVARMGWLSRMTQFKEKAGKHREQASVGLFVYPDLMAADILAYRSTHVPVGEDQKQHLELARNIAAKFNHDYGVELFPLPEPLILGTATRVMSLRDGTRKMSKSDTSAASCIYLNDTGEEIADKIRRARTDSEFLPGPGGLDENGDLPDETRRERPEAYNLLGIYAALADQPLAAVLEGWEGKGFAELKTSLTELIEARLSPLRARMRELSDDPAEIDRILAKGALAARERAEPLLHEVYDIVGLLRAGASAAGSKGHVREASVSGARPL